MTFLSRPASPADVIGGALFHFLDIVLIEASMRRHEGMCGVNK
ncbi:hypothetical protein WIT60_12615 [Aquabacterium sp. G14]